MDLNTKCWIWQGAKNRKGYGQKRLKGKLWITHRLSWHTFNGPIPEGIQVLHKCDTPSCWNPEHLFLGTNQDNVDDKMRKKRHWTFSKTACKNGHPYTEGLYRIRKSDNSRQCKLCERELQRRKYDPIARAQRYEDRRKEAGYV